MQIWQLFIILRRLTSLTLAGPTSHNSVLTTPNCTTTRQPTICVYGDMLKIKEENNLHLAYNVNTDNIEIKPE